MVYEEICRRRSIRKFQDRPVEAEKIDRLVEIALRAPSSRGLNPWEFVVVTEPALLEKLSYSKTHGSAFLKGAPLGIVVCGGEDRSDVWVEDCSIASAFLHLAAGSLGLGSCWIQIRKRQHSETLSSEGFIEEVLSLPAGMKVESIIAVGYPAESKPPHETSELQYEKVHRNAFGVPYRGGSR